MKLRPYQNKLLDQTRQAYRKGFRRPCIVAPCGAGKSIIVAEMARSATEKGNRILFIVHRKELCEQIEETFKWWGVNMDLCKIAMVQTVTRHLDKEDKPDLIITDENHHCKAKSYRRIYDKWPDVLGVGVTATPVRLDGGGLGEVNDELIIGPSVSELIEWGNLSPFKYYAPKIVDTSKLKVRAGEYVKADIEEMFNKKMIWGDVIKHYKKLSNGKAICYCSSVNQSKEMALEFCKAGIPAKHIDAKTHKINRKEAINQFRKGIIKILCNVDLISEGFDVPDCDTAILLRPTKSLGLFIQQSMRCMRWQENKTAIIIDHVGNVNRFGTPDVNHEWSLVPKKKNLNIGDVAIKECMECYRVVPSATKECPHCGFIFRSEEAKDPIIDKNAELIEIEGMGGFTVDYRKPSDCKNMKELYNLADNLGYKRGWAWHKGKALGLIR